MHAGKNGNIRRRIALEAARILADLGHHDYQRARLKAAQRLGCRDRRLFPSNTEIELALQEYQQLFRGRSQPMELRQLRSAALEAMTALAEFTPRLVGPVLYGSADQNSTIVLHLFSDTPEQVVMALMAKKIPWRDGSKTVHYPQGIVREHPLFRFQAGEAEIELIWFPPEGIRQPPLSPLDDRPEKRASADQLRGLLEDPDR